MFGRSIRQSDATYFEIDIRPDSSEWQRRTRNRRHGVNHSVIWTADWPGIDTGHILLPGSPECHVPIVKRWRGIEARRVRDSRECELRGLRVRRPNQQREKRNQCSTHAIHETFLFPSKQAN
jgi:hypothetical protein